MTNYAATPADFQAKVNALLPGDRLTMAAGTYSAATIAVNGNSDEPITIIGYTNQDGSWGSRFQGGTTALTITGSYIHFQAILCSGSTNGVIFNNASHVKLAELCVEEITGIGVQIKNNSHHIFLWGFKMDAFSTAVAQMVKGIVVGTPSASWTNSTTPDRTNSINIFGGQCAGCLGWGIQVCEGAHHVLIEDVYNDMGDTANRPPVGSANGDGCYFSRGDYVHWNRCFSFTPTKNGWKCDRVTVGGVVYGLHQALKGCGSRPNALGPWYAPVASNTDDFKVYKLYWDCFAATFPAFDDTGGTWSATGWEVPAQLYEFMEIGGPARNYHLQPLPFGQYRIFWRHDWRAAVQDGYETYPNNITVGNEFVVDKPNGKVVGYAYMLTVPEVAPSTFCLFREEPGLEEYPVGLRPEDQPVAPNPEDYADNQSYFDALLVWIQVAGEWGGRVAALGEIPRKRTIVETITTIPQPQSSGPGILANQRWIYGYLAQPFDLTPNYHYIAAYYFPAGTTVGGSTGWTMGVFLPDYWGRSYGQNGLINGPLRAPAQRITQPAANLLQFDNRPGNVVNRGTGTTTRESAYDDGLHIPGQVIAYPSFGLLGGAAAPLDVIVSFARTVTEIITVTPDMDLQKILDTRIPGDTVIISGVHRGIYVMRESGTEAKPIHIMGDGTAHVQYRFGRDSSLPAFRVKANYIWLQNIIFEEASGGLLIENGSISTRVDSCTAQFVRDEGFVVQEDAQDACFINCVAHDTGLGLVRGDGFRVGRHASRWIQDGHPDNTSRVLIQGCSAYRNYGNGISACDGSTQVLVKSCSVDYTQGGTLPPVQNVDGASAYYSRADQIQFESCTALGAPGAGFQIFDSEWWPNTVDFGRAQEVKGGSSTGHGDAGVVSQSEGCKVYTDFTASSPRVREIEGGWAAAGSNVATNLFRELVWHSVSQHYPPNEQG